MTAPVPWSDGVASGRGHNAQMDAERRWPALVIDIGPVAALTVLAIVTGGFEQGTDGSLIQVLILAPLLARRLWPHAVLLIVAFVSAATAELTTGPWVQVAAVALASFSCGVLARDRTRSALIVLAIAGLTALGFYAQDVELFEALVFPFAVVVPSWLVGDVLRSRRIEDARRAEAAERSLREQEERFRAAAADERRHVARELHDVVAHAVSVMVIQAGAARQVVRTSPDRAEESLLAVEASGREAMAELRSYLGVLDNDDPEAGLAPQPGIDQLAALIDRVREAGLPAELEVDGTPRPLPTSLDVTVYRIVQEALTNALRYARRAATLVHLSYEPEVLRVEVLDDGPSVPSEAAEASEGSGRGIIGMQQRAALVGGRVEAGPRIGGGYAVRAWLPLKPEPS